MANMIPVEQARKFIEEMKDQGRDDITEEEIFALVIIAETGMTEDQAESFMEGVQRARKEEEENKIELEQLEREVENHSDTYKEIDMHQLVDPADALEEADEEQEKEAEES